MLPPGSPEPPCRRRSKRTGRFSDVSGRRDHPRCGPKGLGASASARNVSVDSSGGRGTACRTPSARAGSRRRSNSRFLPRRRRAAPSAEDSSTAGTSGSPRGRKASEGLEWRRFACGSRWDPEILAREETIWIEVGATHAEAARGAFNREWGKRIEAATGIPGDPVDPEIVLLADLPAGRVEVTILPLYVQGRYRKLDRSLPQTRWPCRRCEGRGCERCDGTGKTYPTSVEELVAAPFLAETHGEATRFHGMGREDIDARMLGRGRPFVLEILRPKTRPSTSARSAERAKVESEGRIEIVEPSLASARDVLARQGGDPGEELSGRRPGRGAGGKD